MEGDIKEFIRKIREGGNRPTVIIDETDDSRLFAVVAAITDDPEAFGKIASEKRGKGKELKYNSTSRSVKRYMEEKIADHGAEVVGVFVDAQDLPIWWEIAPGKWAAHQKMIMDLSEDLIKLNTDFDKIIIDDNDRTLKKNAGERIIRAYMDGVREFSHIGQEDSKTGNNKDIQQTADFAIGATGRILRGRNPPETPVRMTVRNVGKGKQRTRLP